MSLLLALALAAAAARVESVALTTVESQLAVRVVVTGAPGVVAVHREGDAARVSIADALLGLRFAGGRRFSWTPQVVDEDVLARSPARLDRLELAATPTEVSLLLRLPPEASIDVRRDALGLLIRFRPSPATAAATAPTQSPPSPVPVAAPRPAPVVATETVVAVAPVAPVEPAPPPPEAPEEPETKPAGAVSATAPVPAPAATPAPVTADLARALFPGGQSEAAASSEAPSVADLYARLFPGGAPETEAETEPVLDEATRASDDTGIVLGPFHVRAGVDARYVDADTFVDADSDATRDRYLEVAPRVQAEAPLGAGRFTAEYNPSLRAFATYDQVNTSSHLARVGFELPVATNVTLRASDRFVAGTLDTRYADPGGEYFFGLGRFHRNDVDAGASVAVGPRASLELAGTLGAVRFQEESSFFDYETRLVSAGIGYELTPNLRATADYVYDTVPRPDERPEAESIAHSARLRLRGDILPLLTGELAVGYRHQTSPNAAAGGTRYSGLTWTGALERRLSPDASLGLFLSRTTPVSAFEQNAFYVATSLQGSLVLPLPLELQLNGGLGYQWNDYRTVASDIGAPREDRLLGWFVGLRRPVHRRLYLSALYRTEDRRSNLDQFDTETDGFYIQLEWNPLGPPLR